MIIGNFHKVLDWCINLCPRQYIYFQAVVEAFFWYWHWYLNNPRLKVVARSNGWLIYNFVPDWNISTATGRIYMKFVQMVQTSMMPRGQILTWERVVTFKTCEIPQHLLSSQLCIKRTVRLAIITSAEGDMFLMVPGFVRLLVAWFVCRIKQKLVNRFQRNLDRGWASASKRPPLTFGAGLDKGTVHGI